MKKVSEEAKIYIKTNMQNEDGVPIFRTERGEIAHQVKQLAEKLFINSSKHCLHLYASSSGNDTENRAFYEACWERAKEFILFCGVKEETEVNRWEQT